MSAGPESPNTADDGNQKGLRKRRHSRRMTMTEKVSIVVALIGAAGLIGSAVATGIFGIFSNSSSSSTSPTSSATAQACSGFRATVNIPPQVGPYAVLTIDFNCAPLLGQQYLWVVQAKNIGVNHHSEFYPKPFTSGIHIGIPFNHTINFTQDKIGQQNCFYVIMVTNDEYDAIESNLTPNGYTLSLPVGVDQVSIPACETRTN